jgi:AcrR family transcriptional regulator
MTKEDIVRAAFKAWGRELYLNTSLTQVARELGVSKPALYRHFRNKQALLDAMYGFFFDDYAAFVRADYKRAAGLDNKEEKLSVLLRAILEYYARNVYTFLFSLFYVYGKDDLENIEKPFRDRGLDMRAIDSFKEEYKSPHVFQIFQATLIFALAYFHKLGQSFEKIPSDEAIGKLIGVVSVIISKGFSFNNEGIDSLDYERLENRISGAIGNIEDNPLLKAVAEAVAEAGPWNASMEMVAKRSGLSKSSLYAHFRNKKDMLWQLFRGEFRRIIAFARKSIRQSARPEEQLYLGIFSIAAYLRSRPEILVALDWIRTRRLDLGKPEKPGFFRVFDEIDLARAGKFDFDEIVSVMSGDRKHLTQWIMFLIISILMRRSGGTSFEEVPNSRIRDLYRFLTLGMKGFT